MRIKHLLRTALAAITLMFWAGVGWGQTYLIQQGFETTSVPAGWSENSTYYNSTANHGTLTGANGAGFNAVDDWLQTPAVNTAGTLSFWIKGSAATSNIGMKHP